MAQILQHRRNTTAGLQTERGSAGEIIIDTTKTTVVVMDGVTNGGTPLAKESDIPKNISELANDAGYITTATGGSSDRLVNGQAEMLMDVDGNVLMHNNADLNLSGGSIVQETDSNLTIKVKDADDDGYRINISVVDDQDTTLSNLRVRRSGVQISTNMSDNEFPNNWDFSESGSLFAAGDIVAGQRGEGRFIQDCVEGTTSMHWINTQIDSEGAQLIRAYTGNPSYDNAVERAQIKLNWDQVANTATQSGLTIRSFDHTDSESTVNYDWKFRGNGHLEFPDGSVQTTAYTGDNAGDEKIWIETFTSNEPITDFVQAATSIEYDAVGNIVALFNHVIPENNSSTYTSVAKFTPTGVQIWRIRFTNNLNTDGWGLAYDTVGNYVYIAGKTGGTPLTYQFATLTKLEGSNGLPVWSKTYDFEAESSSGVVDVDSNGDPIMVGYGYNGADYYIATTKVDKTNGSVIWSKMIDGQGTDQAYGMAVGPNNEIVAVGYVDQFDSEDTADRMIVIKYASDGTIVWQKTVQFDVGYNCTGADADIDSLGNIYVCGQYSYSVGNDVNSAMSLVKFNSAGVKQWSRRVIGTCETFATSVVMGDDGFLYLSGVTGDDNTTDYSWVIAKYNTDGVVIWQRLIDNVSNWTFSGTFWFGNSGGSNIAVHNGYIALAGAYGNPFINSTATATVIQIDTDATVFSAGDWNIIPATFSGFLDSAASDIIVVDANKTASDTSPNATNFNPSSDTSNFLIGTSVDSTPSVTGNITFDGVNIIGRASIGRYGLINLIPALTAGEGGDFGNFVNNGQYISVYPTNNYDAPHIHIAAGIGPDGDEGDLFLGSDDKYVSVSADGIVSIQSYAADNNSTHRWTFGRTGQMTFPQGTVLSEFIQANPPVNTFGIFANAVPGRSVTIRTSPGGSVSEWVFGTDGSLTLPGGAGFAKGDSGYLKVADGVTLGLDLRDATGRGFYTNGDGFAIRSNGSNTWQFGTGGSLTLPGVVVNSTVAKTGVTLTTAVDLTKSINKLTDGDYTLADGVEGQIMYLVRQNAAVNINISVANARVYGGIENTYPLTFNQDIITLIYTDDAWQQTGGTWD